MRSRRQLLRLVASAIAGFSSVSKSWSNEPAKQYSRAVEQLLTELSVVYSPPQGIQPNADFVDQFLNQELESRKTFFSAISPINPIDIASQLDPAVDYLNVNQFDDVSLMIATSEEVRPVKFVPTLQPVEGESLVELVLNIIVDTLDWRFLYDALKLLANEDPAFSQLLEEVGRKLAIRDLTGLIENLANIVQYITAAETLARIAAYTGIDQASLRKRILKTMGLRLIPFAGWAFTGACLTVTIYSYRLRIRDVLRRVF